MTLINPKIGDWIELEDGYAPGKVLWIDEGRALVAFLLEPSEDFPDIPSVGEEEISIFEIYEIIKNQEIIQDLENDFAKR